MENVLNVCHYLFIKCLWKPQNFWKISEDLENFRFWWFNYIEFCFTDISLHTLANRSIKSPKAHKTLLIWTYRSQIFTFSINLGIFHAQFCYSRHVCFSKRVIVLLDITVLKHGSEVGIRIGNPEACDGSDSGAPQRPAQPQYRPPVMSQTNSSGIVWALLN